MTFNVGMCMSFSRQVSEHFILHGTILHTFSVVDHTSQLLVFEHFRVGNAGVSDIASLAVIRATFTGNDLEEGYTPRTRSVKYENHLTPFQSILVSKQGFSRHKSAFF